MIATELTSPFFNFRFHRIRVGIDFHGFPVHLLRQNASCVDVVGDLVWARADFAQSGNQLFNDRNFNYQLLLYRYPLAENCFTTVVSNGNLGLLCLCLNSSLILLFKTNRYPVIQHAVSGAN